MTDLALQLGLAPLTPAEKVEAFIDALTTHNTLQHATIQYSELIEFAAGNAEPKEEARLDEMVNAEVVASERVIAWGKVLLADGHLERFAAFLRAETAGRP